MLTDAATSVSAIVGLLAGWIYGCMDPVMGIVGALVIANWSYGLVRDAGGVLLEAVPDAGMKEGVRQRLETAGDRITDLHLWRVGPGHNGAIVSLVSHNPRPPAYYKGLLRDLRSLSHTTVEVEAYH